MPLLSCRAGRMAVRRRIKGSKEAFKAESLETKQIEIETNVAKN
jgi:hypothetical protein